MERHGFVTGGTWCVDYNMVLAAWPREETANRILATTRQGGGSGCNFAVDMRRLAPEIPVWTMGLCGDDADGALLRAIAHDNGITARLHVDQSVQTHRTFAFTAQDNGSRTHLFEAESSDHLTPDHFDFDGIPARILHLGLPGTHRIMDSAWGADMNGWVTVLRRARAAGLQTNLELMTIDRGQLRALVLPCLPHLDYLVVNDAEIGALAGIDTLPQGRTDPDQVIAAARAVLTRGTMALVAVHFPGGALAVERGGAVHAQASAKVPVETVKGTNGAGDAFAAGFFCGLHRGHSIGRCLMLAHAAAAASLRSVDTYGAVESAEICLALAQSYGWRDALAITQSEPFSLARGSSG